MDVMWAPYSSTGWYLIYIKYIYIYLNIVFACATLDKIYVYDLHVDKHGKLAE
jgi:dynein intermediate chain 1